MGVRDHGVHHPPPTYPPPSSAVGRKAAGAGRPVLGTVGGYPGRLPGESGSKWRPEGSVELVRKGKRGMNSTGHSKC